MFDNKHFDVSVHRQKLTLLLNHAWCRKKKQNRRNQTFSTEIKSATVKTIVCIKHRNASAAGNYIIVILHVFSGQTSAPHQCRSVASKNVGRAFLDDPLSLHWIQQSPV